MFHGYSIQSSGFVGCYTVAGDGFYEVSGWHVWNRCRSNISIVDSWQVLLLVSYTQNSMGFYIMRGKNHSTSRQVKNEGTPAIRMTLSKCLGR